MIKGKLGKEPLKMDIDTGDDQGVTISEELVSHFTLVAPPTIVGHGTSATHTFDIKQAQVKENLVMGSVVIPSPTVVFSTIFDNVNLGSLLFSHFVVSVDQEHRLLSIQTPKETACTAPD